MLPRRPKSSLTYPPHQMNPPTRKKGPPQYQAALEAGHQHAEAFALMTYRCVFCGHQETIWNSRDGVTPFGTGCPSCGGNHLTHVNFTGDTYAPQHKLYLYQRFWRDGLPEEARANVLHRLKQKGEVPTEEQLKELLNSFEDGWPVLDVFTPEWTLASCPKEP